MLPLALPAPYDYLVPKGMQVAPGQFVVVPLGPVDYLGVVWTRPEGETPPQIERKKLREIIELVDDVPASAARLARLRRLGGELHALLPRHGLAHDDERGPRLRSARAALRRAARGTRRPSA